MPEGNPKKRRATWARAGTEARPYRVPLPEVGTGAKSFRNSPARREPLSTAATFCKLVKSRFQLAELISRFFVFTICC